MADHGEQTVGISDWPLPEAPAVFITAFRSGTGGHRVEVLADRILTHHRHGGTSELRLDEIEGVSTFETTSSQPTYGAHLVRRDNPRDVAYRFDDDATRHAFLHTVERRRRPGAA